MELITNFGTSTIGDYIKNAFNQYPDVILFYKSKNKFIENV